MFERCTGHVPHRPDAAVPRRPRLELPGVPQHIVQRGNNRAPCFFVERDYHLYLDRLAEAATKHGCAIHAYVLMTNHVHLLVAPGAAGCVSRMMQDLGRSYVRIVNDTLGRTGTLWEGRFKSSLVDSDVYLLGCHRYIELNPVRAGMVTHPGQYRWSSHRHYAHGVCDRLITEHEIYRQLGASAHDRQRAFRSLIDDEMKASDIADIRSAANQGWALGSEHFKDRMEAALGRPVRPPKRGRPVRGKPHDSGRIDKISL